VRGTHEAEIVDELKPLTAGQIVLPKTKYIGFVEGEPEKILQKLKPDVVELVGVCTNICVYFAAEYLRNRDYKVRVYERGVASFDPEAHKFALDQMRKVLAVEVVP
jgi:nicotinamidase/pyrazinamidase